MFRNLRDLGAIAVMKSLIGACTLSRKRGLLASNHVRSLFAASSRKKAKSLWETFEFVRHAHSYWMDRAC